MKSQIPLLPLLAVVAGLALGGCADRPAPVEPLGVNVIRDYRFTTTVPDPQGAWNPASYVIVARSSAGFALYDEGDGRQSYFTSKEGRETSHPAWINRTQFVFGPTVNVIELADGRVVGSTDGLTVVDVVDDGVGLQATRTALTDRGYRPRPQGDAVYCQVEDTMMIADQAGRLEDAGKGFFAEPQVGGRGVAWQDQPVVEKDYWSPRPGRGKLIIRWRAGTVSEVPGGVQARWTAEGGIVCTVLRTDPPSGKPWWSVGTDVVYVAGPGQVPITIASDARDPDPHPTEPLVAVTDANGGTRIVARGTAALPSEKRLTTLGERPRWSFDGLRLLTEEGSVREAKQLVVRVLRLQPGAAVQR